MFLSWRKGSGQGDSAEVHGRVDPIPSRGSQVSLKGGMEGRRLQRLPGASWDFIQPARVSLKNVRRRGEVARSHLHFRKMSLATRESGLKGVGMEARRPIRRLSKYCSSKPICQTAEHRGISLVNTEGNCSCSGDQKNPAFSITIPFKCFITPPPPPFVSCNFYLSLAAVLFSCFFSLAFKHSLHTLFSI